ncbi:hypothetical protein [Hungatella hathewayi]|nr:hypothetical protein [Hungatella hathewayi]
MIEYDGADTVESMTEHDEAGALESMMGQDGIGMEAATGLSTRNITGMEAEVSGDWYLTGNAYPQISYFALNEHGIIADYSKVSAIPLLLPEGVTLSHALGDTADLLILPGEIEGQEILWEAGGDIAIDDSRQVLVSGKTVGLISAEAAEEEDTAQAEDTEQISFSPREPVLVQSSLNDNQEFEEDVPQPATSNGNLKASIGSISKTFSLSGSEGEISAGGYADWKAVGKAVRDGTLPMPEKDTDGAYLLSQPSHLAWFMYMVNEAGETGIHGKLTADINMDGTAETDVFTVLNTEWCPIGNAEAHAFTGEFDGNGHTISAIKIEREQTSGNAYGLFGYARDARIQNLYLVGTEILLAGTKPVSAGSLIGQSAGNTVVFRIGVKNSRIQISSSVGAVHGGGVVGNHETGALDFSACYARDTVVESESSGDNCETAAGLVTVNGTDAGAAESSVRSAYFTGTASILGGGTSPQSGAGTVCLRGGTDTMVTNIYYNNISRSTPEGSQAGEELTREQLTGKEGTYLLNGENITGVWAYSEGELPELSLYEARLTFSNWIEVGEALDNGTLGIGEKPSGDGSEAHPYQISTPEQLAWFSYRVWNFNDTDSAICGDLTTDIDLTGETYGGTTEAPLGWIPIGRNLNNGVVKKYYGKFGQNHERIYQIRNMNINGIDSVSRYSGLFGFCAGDGMIRRIGIESGIFNGILAGGIVGSVEDNAVIEECYNKVSIGPIRDVYHYIGGIAGACGGNGVIKNCFNLGNIDSGAGARTQIAAGGIVSKIDGNARIINCYHGTGSVSASYDKSAITAIGSSTSKVINCYYETGLGVGDSSATGISKTQLQSWAAAYALNGQKVDGPWAFTEGSYPGFGELERPKDWSVVGQGLIDGLLTSSSRPTGDGNVSSPLQISSAEQLAWFALQVNNGNPELCAELKADINLFGGLYSGFAYDTGDPDIINKALQWIPIGSDADGKRYTGTFNGNGHTVSAMLAKGTEKQGLFGTLGDNAAIKKTGISDSWVEASSGVAGGIAGYVRGTNVVITECGNKAGSLSGDGMFFGGCVGLADGNSSLILDGCYNEGNISVPGGMMMGGIIGNVPVGNTGNDRRVVIRNCMNRGKVEGRSSVGGIIGCAVPGTTTITGCWNAGIVSSSEAGRAGSIKGTDLDSADELRDCLVDENYKYGDIGNCPTVKSKALGTWGAAWWLNGGSLKQSTGLSWAYDKDSPYPVLSATGLSSAESWEQIGEALEYGLLKETQIPTGNGSSIPYQIQTAEQLAWFAWKVNVGRMTYGSHNINLTEDMDLFGEKYTGYTGEKNLANIEKALRWIPIGDSTVRYGGTFDGGGHEIDKMYVNGGERYSGFVGAGSYPCQITKMGIGPNSKVVARGEYGGLFVGVNWAVDFGSLEITSCYNRGTIVNEGSSTDVAAFIGGHYNSYTPPPAIISNCYNAGDTVGFANLRRGIIENCYADITLNSQNAVHIKNSGSGVTGLSTDEMKSSGVAASLNTFNGTMKTGTDRVWYTSLDTEKTKGYPTFQAPKTVKVTFEPDTMGADGKETTLPGYLRILNMKLRAIGLTDENFTPGRVPASDSEFQLVAEGSIKGTDSGYSSYGYTNANKNVAVKAGTVDLQPVVSTASLNNPVTSLGTVDKVALNIAAAYTRSTQRNLLLEGASGNDRYEICIAIAGVTSKSLVVDLPVSVAMADELMPDGTEKTAYSVDTAIQNSQNYPMEGKILKAVPISKTDKATYQALKPIAKTTNYGSGQIYEAGVRLGITNPKTGTGVISGDLYYNPDATGDTNPWMTCQLKAAGGTLPYRYFLKYKADPYYDSEHPNFGYTISYQFGIMADDYSAAAGAAAFQ